MSGPDGHPATLREVFVGDAGFPRWELADWAAHGLVAGVTAAAPGTGLGLLDHLTPPAREERWSPFLATLEPQFHAAVIARQVHGNSVGVVTTAQPGLNLAPDRDGHATRLRGVMLAVSVADCIPVFLADLELGAVCLIHAGWRGTASRILAAGVDVLKSLGGKSVENLVIHCGVGVCGICYEVGKDVATAVTGVEYKQTTTLDLRAELARQARDLGVSAVSVTDHCTIHGPPGFFSHRRSGGSPDRMVAYLGLPQT